MQNESLPIDQTLSERNAELTIPILELRKIIAERWHQISVLLKDLNIQEKKILSEKILKTKATSEHIRKEVVEIMRVIFFVEHDKTQELGKLLCETNADLDALQRVRNKVYDENRRIVGTFLSEEFYRDFYAEVLDLDTRRSLAEEGLLRAIETFDPSLGKLSTYAFWTIKGRIQKAGIAAKKAQMISLDRERGKNGDSVNLLKFLNDSDTEPPEITRERFRRISALQELLPLMTTQWRRVLELTFGLGTNPKRHKPTEIIDIMNNEDLQGMKGRSPVTREKVHRWLRDAKRWIEKKMGPLFEEKEGDK